MMNKYYELIKDLTPEQIEAAFRVTEFELAKNDIENIANSWLENEEITQEKYNEIISGLDKLASYWLNKARSFCDADEDTMSTTIRQHFINPY